MQEVWCNRKTNSRKGTLKIGPSQASEFINYTLPGHSNELDFQRNPRGGIIVKGPKQVLDNIRKSLPKDKRDSKLQAGTIQLHRSR